MSKAKTPPEYGDGPGSGAGRIARIYCGISSSKRSHAEHRLSDGREVLRSSNSENKRFKHV